MSIDNVDLPVTVEIIDREGDGPPAIAIEARSGCTYLDPAGARLLARLLMKLAKEAEEFAALI